MEPDSSTDIRFQEDRRIRSFVRRAGRMTIAQQRALKEYWPDYGLDYTPSQADLNQVFGRSAGRILEIGFGAGHNLEFYPVEVTEVLALEPSQLLLSIFLLLPTLFYH